MQMNLDFEDEKTQYNIINEDVFKINSDYESEFDERNCLLLTPLCKHGCSFRLIEQSHKFDSFNDMIDLPQAVDRCTIVHLLYGEYLYAHPKLLISQWQATNYNLFLEINAASTPYWVPRSVYRHYLSIRNYDFPVRKRTLAHATNEVISAKNVFPDKETKKYNLRNSTELSRFCKNSEVRQRHSDPNNVLCNQNVLEVGPMDQYLFSSSTGKPFQELSKEEKGKVAEYLNKMLQTREEKNRSVKSDLWGIEVTNDQIQCLREKNWLNDQVINLNFKLMAQRDILNYFMSTFFFSCLYDLQLGKYDYLHGRKQYPPMIDIFAFKKVFVPINIGNFHWILAVIYMEHQAIYLFDSMSSSTHSKRILNALLQFLRHEMIFRKTTSLAESDAINANWTLVDSMTRCPQQDNSYDCGVFTTMFADKLSKNDSLTTCVQGEALNYRELMAAAIINLAVEYVKNNSNNNK